MREEDKAEKKRGEKVEKKGNEKQKEKEDVKYRKKKKRTKAPRQMVKATQATINRQE